MAGKSGFLLVLVGLVLAVFLPNLEFFWFTGRAFGVLLVVLGAFELFEHRGGRRNKGIVEGLRDGIIGSPRGDFDDHNRETNGRDSNSRETNGWDGNGRGSKP
ncbi:MAG: hypothetical protein WBQ44_02010 [Rhodococcus sp. (in: high G+C Gram-positive bacteria)]